MIAGKNSASTRKLTATGGNARCQPVAAASLYIDRPRVRSLRRSETADARALPMHLDGLRPRLTHRCDSRWLWQEGRIASAMSQPPCTV